MKRGPYWYLYCRIDTSWCQVVSFLFSFLLAIIVTPLHGPMNKQTAKSPAPTQANTNIQHPTSNITSTPYSVLLLLRMLYAYCMNHSQVNLNPPWTHVRPIWLALVTYPNFPCDQVSKPDSVTKCLPGSIAFSPNQNPQNQPKSLNIKAGRIADHIAKGCENGSAICDESGRGRRVDGRNSIAREGMRVFVEGEASYILPMTGHIA